MPDTRHTVDLIRHSVDISAYPELVVVYLGMRAKNLRGIATLWHTGKTIRAAVAAKPDGLLAHEFLLFGPLHVGMRQYWRDLDSLEIFTHASPHKNWWANFARNDGGTGFWHEAYRAQGGIEGIYLNMPSPLGLQIFATPRAPDGDYSTARERLG